MRARVLMPPLRWQRRSGDDWEEVHGEEAEAVAMQLLRGRGARGAHAVEPPVGSGEADMEEADGGDAGISLAGNGVELVRAWARCAL